MFVRRREYGMLGKNQDQWEGKQNKYVEKRRKQEEEWEWKRRYGNKRESSISKKRPVACRRLNF